MQILQRNSEAVKTEGTTKKDASVRLALHVESVRGREYWDVHAHVVQDEEHLACVLLDFFVSRGRSNTLELFEPFQVDKSSGVAASFGLFLSIVISCPEFTVRLALEVSSHLNSLSLSPAESFRPQCYVVLVVSVVGCEVLLRMQFFGHLNWEYAAFSHSHRSVVRERCADWME